MEIKLSQRSLNVKPSATLAMNARAKALKKAGGDIISLSVGEPDFDTPLYIKEAAIAAINEGFTKYTAVDGIPALKDAIITKFNNENDLHYTPEQILVSTGAKQSIYNLLQAFINPGDEVIIPAPYWTSYPDMVILADGKPVIVNTSLESRYKITPQELEAAITPNTKLLMFNTPSNPSGMVYTHEELAALGEVLMQYPHVYIMTDDIYEHIIWTHRSFANLVNLTPDLYDRTIVVNGVSKAYAMTGWRIGYAAGPKEIIAGMRKIQSQSTSNPNSIAQKAAAAALQGGTDCIKEMVQEFKSRHDFLYQGLRNIPGFNVQPSDGTFYLLPDVSDIINSKSSYKDDVEFADVLLAKTGVAVVPGTAFGQPGTIRISFATSMEMLNDALKRIKTIV